MARGKSLFLQSEGGILESPTGTGAGISITKDSVIRIRPMKHGRKKSNPPPP